MIFISSADFRATLECNVCEKWCIGERERDSGGRGRAQERASEQEKEEITEMQRNVKLKGRDNCIQHLLTVRCKCQALSRVCVCGGVCISMDTHALSRSVVSNSAAPWTVACQAPLSMEFSRQEYWVGLPCPPPGDLPNPGVEPGSPTLQADSLPSEPPGTIAQR